ncbi:MAG: sugar phosphate isomerase/epimerase [Spirochaetaceae bacterium]|nr:sugar phosphate isomerase/epimerase [Spirochaetaceae bacterium]
MHMRLGCFGYIKDLDAIAEAGFDCAELHIRELMGFDEAEYRAARKRLRDSGIPADVFDNPIPLDSRIADPSFDLGFYRSYLERACDRAAEMGARYIVFGNGKARSLPIEGDIEAARAKFDEFFIMLLDIAAQRNITILIEPLGRKLSNIVNSLPEAVAFIRKYGRHNLKTFIDYRYMVEMQRPLSDIEEYELYIRHVHLDNPLTVFPERLVPRLDDGFDYAPFLETLKKISYKEIISIEASVFREYAQDIRSVIDFFAAHNITPYRAD